MGKWSQKNQICLIFQQESWVWICLASWFWRGYALAAVRKGPGWGRPCDCGCVGVEGDVQPSDSPGAQSPPTRPSPAGPPHITHVFVAPGLPYYRQAATATWPQTLFLSGKQPPKKPSYWPWKRWFLVRKMPLGRDNARIDEALLCGQEVLILLETLNRW